MKNLIRRFVPPIFLEVYRAIFNRKYGFLGDYASWEEASGLCEGYEGDHLFGKVKAAALAVKSGLFFCERDSVLFGTPQYSWSSLACLMAVAAREGGRLSVLDFGGSLGSSYFLNRRFLSGIDSEWSVIEQPHFVAVGASEIAEDTLRFYPNIDTCLANRRPNVLLLSSVIQYLPDPWQFLDDFFSRGWRYVIVDRTPFNEKGRDILKIQHVDPVIYRASYPAWILSEEAFVVFFTSKGYKLVESFTSAIDDFGPDISVKGFFLSKAV